MRGQKRTNGRRSPLEEQVANVLRRARKLPIGVDRNDLRQLANNLLWLHRNGPEAKLGKQARSESGRPASLLAATNI